MTDILGYLMTFAGLAGIAVGTRLVSSDAPSGWLLIAGGLASAVFAYFLMRPKTPRSDAHQRNEPTARGRTP